MPSSPVTHPTPANAAGRPVAAQRDFRTRLAVAKHERDRRKRLRRTILKDVPRPHERFPAAGTPRPDLWPPAVEPLPRGGRTREALLERLRTFAAARGPDFSGSEFQLWARLGNRSVYGVFGSWTAMREAAGLPPARFAPAVDMLHKLLWAYDGFLSRHGRRPAVRELADAAGISTTPIVRRGVIAAVADLHREWADEAAWRRDAEAAAGREAAGTPGVGGQ